MYNEKIKTLGLDGFLGIDTSHINTQSLHYWAGIYAMNIHNSVNELIPGSLNCSKIYEDDFFLEQVKKKNKMSEHQNLSLYDYFMMQPAKESKALFNELAKNNKKYIFSSSIWGDAYDSYFTMTDVHYHEPVVDLEAQKKHRPKGPYDAFKKFQKYAKFDKRLSGSQGKSKGKRFR